MRAAFVLCIASLLAACGEGAALVGTLTRDTEATHVWVVGRAERSPVVADSFHLEELPEGAVLDLRFARDEGEAARMEIRRAPPGRMVLRDIWFERGLAFPTAVEMGGAEWVVINGLRMGPAEALPDEVDIDASVLSVSEEADALIVRPADDALPDLRVVVTPGTLVRSPNGDPLELDRVEHGDALHVRGTVEQGYVIATEILLPRERGR